MSVGISLGWNCYIAMWAVENGIRKTKDDGYLTCPFDLMASNFKGMIQCLQDDFKDFTNPDYLAIIDTSGITFEHPIYQSGELLIVNTKYNFIFNHESPTHGNLYLHEGWRDGTFHFCKDNFKEFIARYDRRIENFRQYIELATKENLTVHFIVKTLRQNVAILENVLQTLYPHLQTNVIFQDVEQDYYYNLFLGNMEFMENIGVCKALVQPLAQPLEKMKSECEMVDENKDETTQLD